MNYLGFDKIHDLNYFALIADEEEILYKINRRSDAVNFYLINSAYDNAHGAAELPGTALFVINDHALSVTSVHELGHCFGLYHTHEKSFGIEAISGKDCDKTGDLICDTPADPVLNTQSVSGDCRYTSDIYPDSTYMPDPSNIMSYAPLWCKNRFTEGQAASMLSSITYHPKVKSAMSTTCAVPEIVGSLTICDDDIETYQVNNVTNMSWSLPNNSAFVVASESGYEISLSRKNNATGNKLLEVHNEDFQYFFNKEIYLGETPVYTSSQILGTTSQVGVNSYDQVRVNKASNVQKYEWSIVDDYGSCGANYAGPVFDAYGGRTEVTTSSRYMGVSFGSCEGTFRIRCRATNPCGSVSYTDRVVTVVGSGCSTMLSIYPNPSVQDVVTLKIIAPCATVAEQTKAESNQTSYTIYDKFGKVKLQKKKAKKSIKLNLNGLKKGVYQVEAVTEEGERIVEQLIKE